MVLYSTGHVMWATRAWWLLHYCGHSNARVLDGGFRAWRDAGLPVSTETVTPAPRTFHAQAKPDLFADKEAVLAAIGDSATCTVNALSPEVYAGEGDFTYGRRGHITGSVNLHFDDLLDNGHFKDADALRAALDAKGLLTAPKVISYCGGGISATVDALACLLVGQSNVAVYDGSMAEWVRDDSLPMGDGLVGAGLVPAHVGHANAANHTNTGDHKGRPYGGLRTCAGPRRGGACPRPCTGSTGHHVTRDMLPA